MVKKNKPKADKIQTKASKNRYEMEKKADKILAKADNHVKFSHNWWQKQTK